MIKLLHDKTCCYGNQFPHMFYWLLSIHTKHFISTFLNIFFFHPAEQKKQVLSAVSDMGNKKWMNNYVKIAWNFARGFDRMRKYLSRSQIKCSSPFILRYAVRTFITVIYKSELMKGLSFLDCKWVYFSSILPQQAL